MCRLDDPTYGVLMNGSIQIQCKRCGQVLSGVLTELTDYDALNYEDDEPLMDVGVYCRSELIVADELFFGSQPEEILVYRDSLADVIEGGPRSGCCGPSDGKWNLFCFKNHRIGIEMADCYMPHFVRVPLNRVKLIEVSGEASAS
ncbi:MAG: hypothetical protein DHS20C16_17910 [Phycisphaerae bacterium]|nr:MAG: hypothetical protein DHS20C16_17910 [Phycisphaerae bacterium]